MKRCFEDEDLTTKVINLVEKGVDMLYSYFPRLNPENQYEKIYTLKTKEQS